MSVFLGENVMAENLTKEQQVIAAAAAYTALGNQTELKQVLNNGLDNGVTVNEFKEILVQAYAYCGFPRSLNALATLMQTVEERGNKDKLGNEPSTKPESDALTYGTENQTKLIGSKVKGKLFEFAPAIDKYLNAHIEIGKHNGLTDNEVAEIMNIATKAKAQNVVFGFGELNPYGNYFTGKSYLKPITTTNGVPMYNVTFEPKCRNNWHIHHKGGQILLVTQGRGWYQAWGEEPRELKAGDVVNIPAETKHWHGAAKDSWFTHIAVEVPSEGSSNEWLEPVTDEEYNKLQ